MANRKATAERTDSAAEAGVSLNFKVSADFRKAFKGFAVARGISMTDLLKEGFVLSQKQRGK